MTLFQAQAQETYRFELDNVIHPDSFDNVYRFYGSVICRNNDWLVVSAASNVTFSDHLFFYELDPLTKSFVFKQRIALDFDRLIVDMSFAGDQLCVLTQQSTVAGQGKILGAVKVFSISSGSWTNSQTIDYPQFEHRYRYFNQFSVSGNKMLLGAKFATTTADGGQDTVSQSGTAFLYERDENGTWVFSFQFKADPRYHQDKYGTHVQVYKNIIAIGAPYHYYDETYTDVQPRAGKIYIYNKLSDSSWHLTKELTSPTRKANQYFGNLFSLGETGLIIGEFSKMVLGSMYFINIHGEDFQPRRLFMPPIPISTIDVNRTIQKDGMCFFASTNAITSEFYMSSDNSYNGTVLAYKLNGDNLHFFAATRPPAEYRDHNGYGIDIEYSDSTLYVGYIYHRVYKSKVSLYNGSVHSYRMKKCTPVTTAYAGQICDSMVSESRRFVRKETGMYEDTVYHFNACTEFFRANITIRNGTYGVLDTAGCFAVKAPSGKTLHTTGTYLDTITNSNGCDSILTINFTNRSADASFNVSNGTFTAIDFNLRSYQWFDCITGEDIEGETSVSFSPTEEGLYGLRGTNEHCTNESACYSFQLPEPIVTPDSILSSKNDIIVYPNPSEGQFTIVLFEIKKDVEVHVMDAQGRILATKFFGEFKFHILELPMESGLYYIRVIVPGEADRIVTVLRL